MMLIPFLLFLVVGSLYGDSLKPSRSDRIIGGANVNKGSYPFAVSLQSAGNHFCGGSIYSTRYILSAAHCFTADRLTPQNFFLLAAFVGSNDLEDPSGIRHAFNKVIIHPAYNESAITNDIALVKLETPIKLNNFAKVVNLESTFVNSIRSTVSIGWGRITPEGEGSRILQQLSLQSTTLATCQKSNFAITDSQICNISPINKGICQGDSGGPVIYNNIQIGVHSFVINGCGSQYPEVSVRVSAYIPWIQQNSVS